MNRAAVFESPRGVVALPAELLKKMSLGRLECGCPFVTARRLDPKVDDEESNDFLDRHVGRRNVCFIQIQALLPEFHFCALLNVMTAVILSLSKLALIFPTNRGVRFELRRALET